MTGNSICIVSFSPIYRDARVLRQIEHLSPHFPLVVIGYGDRPAELSAHGRVTWVRIEQDGPFPRVTGQMIRVYLLLGRLAPSFFERRIFSSPAQREALRQAIAHDCAAYHANEWDALPVAGRAAQAKGALLVFDAHEYSPSGFEQVPGWTYLFSPMIRAVIRKYAPTASATVTVAPRIRDLYREEFGIDPVVVMNAPDLADVREHDVDPHCIRLVHHGSAMRDRNLGLLIETLALCDERYRLHFMLMDDEPGYVDELRRMAERHATGRVIFERTVPPSQIVERISAFDVGIHLLAPTNRNNYLALPNKLFDFIAAGLAICVGPSPSMIDLIDEHRVGWIAPSFVPGDVASMLNALSADDIREKRTASRLAAQVVNARHEMGKLVHIYRDLLSTNHA